MKIAAVSPVQDSCRSQFTGKMHANINQEEVNRSNKNGPQEIKQDKVISAIEEANKFLVSSNTRLEFSIHEKTKQIMVKVLDENTGELIREVPPEKILDMVAKMWEIVGLFIDEKV